MDCALVGPVFWSGDQALADGIVEDVEPFLFVGFAGANSRVPVVGEPAEGRAERHLMKWEILRRIGGSLALPLQSTCVNMHCRILLSLKLLLMLTLIATGVFSMPTDALVQSQSVSLVVRSGNGKMMPSVVFFTGFL